MSFLWAVLRALPGLQPSPDSQDSNVIAPGLSSFLLAVIYPDLSDQLQPPAQEHFIQN